MAGHELHRWTDQQGQEWACEAYDHGPFCRLCIPVNTDYHRLLLDLAERGDVEATTTRDGSMTFALAERP